MRKPFAPHQISKLPKPTSRDAKKGRCAECGGWHGLPAVHLDYVGHAALTDRLLDADPGWTWEPLAMTPDGLPVIDGCGGMWIKLTVCRVTRLGYGHAGDKTGGDAIKEIIGDALRNAAMRFGAALDLWHKGDLHLDAEQYQDRVTEPRNDNGTLQAGGTDNPKRDAFEALQPEMQDSLRKIAQHVTAAMPDAARAKDILIMGLEEWPDEDQAQLKIAAWHLLDSKTRAAIKKVEAQ